MKPTWIMQIMLGAMLGVGIMTVPSHAAERVVVKYGTLQDSIAVSELKTLAETGNTSLKLKLYMMATSVNPDGFRTALGKTIRVTPSPLDSVLISPVGQLAMDRLGTAITPLRTTSSREALALALLKSASNDGKVSLIEVLEKYPTPEVKLDVDQALSVVQHLQALERPLSTVWDLLKGRL